MKKLISIILALAVVAIFAFGCAGVAKDAKIKCPKCASRNVVRQISIVEVKTSKKS